MCKAFKNAIPNSYTPIPVIIVVFGFLFFPSKHFCNGKGRLYVLKKL